MLDSQANTPYRFISVKFTQLSFSKKTTHPTKRMETALARLSLNEAEEEEEFQTPPSSPVRSCVVLSDENCTPLQSTKKTIATKSAVRSLARNETTRAVRQAHREEEEEEFRTSPSSPVLSHTTRVLDENNTPLQLTTKKNPPRSLAKSGAKRGIRKVQYLKTRIQELRGCAVEPIHSFYVSNWWNEFDELKEEQLHKNNNPRDNVAIMLRRVEAVQDLLHDTFSEISGVYIGKTCQMKVRFVKHEQQKRKTGHMLVMVAIAVFGEQDIPQEDIERWGFNVDVFGLNYERLLSKAVIDAGMKVYGDSEEAAGGGRANSRREDDVTVYALYSVAS